VYTDFLVHGVIEMLKKYPERRCCVLFVPDHGESLGEGGLDMHGVPLMMAPDYQTDIPFLVWTSDNAPAVKETGDQVSHYHVFHSILKFYGIETPFYDESKNIFK
jgi:lipid A ethanolaminephosphotransferase